MDIKDIIASAYNISGKVTELSLNEKGAAKFESAYGFKGTFNFGIEDMDAMLHLMADGQLESDTFLASANGILAGHNCEFTGQIIMCQKRQAKTEAKRYVKETIQLQGTGCGTIAVMEWIEANGCPELENVFFNEGQRDVLTVSSYNDENFIAKDKAGMIDWYEVQVNGKTAHRWHKDFWWVFKINGNYYFATA